MRLPEKGDLALVTLKGEVDRLLDVGFSILNEDRSVGQTVYTNMIHSVEVLPPPEKQWVTGDVVRSATGWVYVRHGGDWWVVGGSRHQPHDFPQRPLTELVPKEATAVTALLFKATAAGRTPTHAGNGFVWPAPAGKRPGKWTDTVTDLEPCARGYHLTGGDHLVDWLNAELWVAEGRGEHLDAGNKQVFGSARLLRRLPWDDRSARLFAADCAEHVLHLFEREYPDDDRPRTAIAVARAYARGEIGAAPLQRAGDAAAALVNGYRRPWPVDAGVAGWHAAWAAALAAAGAAEAATWTWAAGSARSAAWDAADAAAAWPSQVDGHAARAAERNWQTRTLFTALQLNQEMT